MLKLFHFSRRSRERVTTTQRLVQHTLKILNGVKIWSNKSINITPVILAENDPQSTTLELSQLHLSSGERSLMIAPPLNILIHLTQMTLKDGSNTSLYSISEDLENVFLILRGFPNNIEVFFLNSIKIIRLCREKKHYNAGCTFANSLCLVQLSQTQIDQEPFYFCNGCTETLI